MNLKKLAIRLRDLHDGDVPSDLGAFATRPDPRLAAGCEPRLPGKLTAQ